MLFYVMDGLKNIWSLIMNSSLNPLKNIPDLAVRHWIMQILAFMWSGVFSIYIIESIYVFGMTAIAHALLIMAIFFTAIVFETARRKPEVFESEVFKKKKK